MEERLHKILLVGDMGCGKSSFMKRLVHCVFSGNYKATVGVDFGLKVKNVDNISFRLQFWDIAGQEKYGSRTKVYYEEASGAFVFIDLTRKGTIDTAKIWKRDLDNKINMKKLYSPEINPVILLVNKLDLLEDEVEKDYYDSFCQEHGFHSWFAISCKDNVGIDEACMAMVDICKTAISQPVEAKDPEPVIPKVKEAFDPEKEINGFLKHVFTLLINQQSDDQKIDALEMICFRIGFESGGQHNNWKRMESNEEFRGLVKKLYHILYDESMSNRGKINTIKQYIIKYGLRNYLGDDI
jgi:Ras-related protein Rab-32